MADADVPMDTALHALPANLYEALLILTLSRRPDAGLFTALATAGAATDMSAYLATLGRTLPDLLEGCADPPGVHVQPAARSRLVQTFRRREPDRWAALHARAAAYYAALAGNGGDGTGACQTEEVCHLWAAGAAERHARLDTLFRERLHNRDGTGCQALLDAAADADGEGDPLLALCRGIIASEITRDWGAAEARFHEVLGCPDLSPSLHIRALMELGLLDRYQGRYDEAQRRLAETCRLAGEARDEMTLARALINRGIVCAEGWMQRQLPQDALDEALACLARSKDILHERGERELELRAWNNMGAVYKEMSRLDDALAAYRAAMTLTDPSERYMRALLINNMGEVEELQGRWAQAQDAYAQALALYRELDDDFEVADALLNLGSVQERRGLFDTALASYRAAIATIESIRARLKAEETRTGFLGTRLAPYERLIRLSLTRPGGEVAAFETVERAKARAFIELLAERPLHPPQAVPPALLQRERELRDDLAHLYAMGASGPSAAQTIALETELEEVYRQMRRLDAQYAAMRTVDPLPLAEVQRRLPPGSALLEYFATGDELGCFVITRASAHAQMLPGAAASLHHHMTDAPAEHGLPAAAICVTDDTPASAELYAALLAPIAGLLDGHEDVFIVPHGLLHYLPLHALGGAAASLLDRSRVTYAPSASILLRDASERAAGETAQAPGSLVLGYDAGLHYAEMEARHVAALAGGAAYTGRDATAAVLSREGSRYRALHLACHGDFNPQAPLASGLLLADGKLDAMAILQGLRLRADLVVLSACDTGQAAVLRGDELMGLARAFLYAGAAAVLVSLWPVDDLATALLMDAFYRARATLPPGPVGSAEALRCAQRALRALSYEEALAACTRLRAAAPRDDTTAAWADLSLASLHATAGDGAARRIAARARGALPHAASATVEEWLARAAETAMPARPAPQPPYAHPYYWAAFTLICGGLSPLSP